MQYKNIQKGPYGLTPLDYKLSGHLGQLAGGRGFKVTRKCCTLCLKPRCCDLQRVVRHRRDEYYIIMPATVCTDYTPTDLA